jgi:hypothetical protein
MERFVYHTHLLEGGQLCSITSLKGLLRYPGSDFDKAIWKSLGMPQDFTISIPGAFSKKNEKRLQS